MKYLEDLEHAEMVALLREGLVAMAELMRWHTQTRLFLARLAKEEPQ